LFYREIQRSIPGITTRMLSKELKEMELNKIIVRKVYDASPVAVEYETTPYCKTFGNIILAMIDWGKKHKKMITSPNPLPKGGTKNPRKSEPGARKMQKL
jgi:DNA-binding HxlR family transcriptional regulator